MLKLVNNGVEGQGVWSREIHVEKRSEELSILEIFIANSDLRR